MRDLNCGLQDVELEPENFLLKKKTRHGLMSFFKKFPVSLFYVK